jgi:hypothetical protein
MPTQDNKDEIKAPEKNIPSGEQTINFEQEGEKHVETKETSKSDAIVSAELRREIELMELDPVNNKAAEVEREKIAYLGEAEKIEHLLQLAREKGGQSGLVFAVQTAKKMNEPYLLDLLHDSLSKEGFYQDFVK